MKTSSSIETNKEQMQLLKEKIEDLKKRWPAHSVPPTLMLELDDLEEELAKELEKARQERQCLKRLLL